MVTEEADVAHYKLLRTCGAAFGSVLEDPLWSRILAYAQEIVKRN